MFRQPKASSSGPSVAGRKVVRSTGEKCHYPNRVCNQPVLEPYDYCLKHILEDKNAPYKPCGFTYAINNKRCLQPALRGDKRDIGFCSEHIWKAGTKRQKAAAKRVTPMTPESLLSGLSHYVRPSSKQDGVTAGNEDFENIGRGNKPVNPFVDIETGIKKAGVLECGSESDSDVEPATLETVWNPVNEQSSDAESTDSQLDDPLRHAGVYTAEEVILMTRNKMIRLQKLYRRQFERLAHVLKEKRRKYLHGLKKEKETLSTIYEQGRTSAKEQKLYEKLKALNRYQKRSAAETLAYLASQEKRAKVLGGANYKPSGHTTKCAFTEGGVRCARATLPLSKFCFKHILEDQNQCIFKACGCEKADTVCKDPVFGLFDGDTCVLHIKLPTLPHLNVTTEEQTTRSFSEISEDKPKLSLHNLIHSKTATRAETDAEDLSHGGPGSGSNGGGGNGGNGDNESEFDASATESAVSTENHGSPMDQDRLERIMEEEEIEVEVKDEELDVLEEGQVMKEEMVIMEEAVEVNEATEEVEINEYPKPEESTT